MNPAFFVGLTHLTSVSDSLFDALLASALVKIRLCFSHAWIKLKCRMVHKYGSKLIFSGLKIFYVYLGKLNTFGNVTEIFLKMFFVAWLEGIFMLYNNPLPFFSREIYSKWGFREQGAWLTTLSLVTIRLRHSKIL